ncbi:MAG TPA: rhomboid-like protein [Pseudonocardiaceae bacterium]|jgi:hypothetical protein|nr:rhomboid-like protein [Pseudonocardiaceae bacterium]
MTMLGVDAGPAAAGAVSPDAVLPGVLPEVAVPRSWRRRIGAPARRGLALLPHPKRTPFTFWYLMVLAATTLMIDFATPAAVHRIMAMSSTSAVNLERHPVQVLFLSALWLADQHWLIYAAIFTAVIAPLERKIGTKATLLVFASGHVLATLATELPVLVAVHAHWLPRVDGHLVDIGVSYGFFATAGALLLMLPSRPRWWAIAALNATILAIYLDMGLTSVDSVVTAIGHLLAAYVGMLGWLPWLRKRHLVGSLTMPAWLGRRAAAVPAAAI